MVFILFQFELLKNPSFQRKASRLYMNTDSVQNCPILYGFGLYLHSFWSSFSGNGTELVCQSIRSCLWCLSCAPWAQKTWVFWKVTQQRKCLILFALARLTRIRKEPNFLVYSFSDGAWVHFCTQFRLKCLKLNCFEQPKWVARSWLILWPSSWIKCSDVIVFKVLAGKNIILHRKISWVSASNFVFQAKDRVVKKTFSHWWSKGGSSLEVNCKLVETKRLGTVWCLIRDEIRIRWGFNPTTFTVTSNCSSVVVWFKLVSSRLRVLVEY